MNLVSLWSNEVYSRSDIKKFLDKIILNESGAFEKAKLENTFAETKQYQLQEYTLRFTVIPLLRELNFYGYLLVGITPEKIPLHEVVIKHGITALFLDAIKNNAIKEYHKTMDIKLIEKVFYDHSTTELHADSLYYNVSKVKYVITGEVLDSQKIKYNYFFLNNIVKEFDPNCLLWISNTKILGLIQTDIPASFTKILEEKAEDLFLGISDKLENFNTENIKKNYDQAVVALKQARYHHSNVCFWEQLGIEKIINSMEKNPLLRDYDKEMLNPLLQYDTKNGTDLTYTTYVYLKNFFSLKETGEELFLHPNTIKYRIDKAKEILNISFNHSSEYMRLMMAFSKYFYKKRD